MKLEWEIAGKEGQGAWRASSALIVRRCTLFWAEFNFLGIGSEEWAVLVSLSQHCPS